MRYAYRCRDHGDWVERYPIGKAPAEATCPECGEPGRRVIGQVAIHYAWHATPADPRTFKQLTDGRDP